MEHKLVPASAALTRKQIAESLQAECERLRTEVNKRDEMVQSYYKGMMNWTAHANEQQKRAEQAERKLAEAVAALNGLLINCPICGGQGFVETGMIQRDAPFTRDCGYCASALKVYNEATK